MLQVIDKTDIAERKPYKYSEKVSARMRKERKVREMKRKNMARNITKIDTLTEITDNIETDGIFSGNVLDRLLEN
jgi:hypothetical protein